MLKSTTLLAALALSAAVSFADTTPLILNAPLAENNAAARAYFECVVGDQAFIQQPERARERCQRERDFLAASVAPEHRHGVVERMDSIIDLRWRRESESATRWESQE